jgi:hypothetical protein
LGLFQPTGEVGLKKAEIDKAAKDVKKHKKYPADFKITLRFESSVLPSGLG